MEGERGEPMALAVITVKEKAGKIRRNLLQLAFPGVIMHMIT